MNINSVCERCGRSDGLKTMQFNSKGIAALAKIWPGLGRLLLLKNKRLCAGCMTEYGTMSSKHTNLRDPEAQERYLEELIPWYLATPSQPS